MDTFERFIELLEGEISGWANYPAKMLVGDIIRLGKQAIREQKELNLWKKEQEYKKDDVPPYDRFEATG